MSEMIDRVARAIVRARGLTSAEYALSPDNLNEAKAAIQEMREPTAEMLKAGSIYWDPQDGGLIKLAFDPLRPFQLMINAALKE